MCNHTVALFFQTAQYSQLRVPVVPPVHSCTESEQQWHKPRTVGVKPGPINSMIFTKPVPNRMAQTGVRSGFYRGMVGPLPDPCLFRITEAYAKFNIEDRPLVTTMNMRPDKPLVESAFGVVQEGSVLSYQQPVLTTRYITLHRDAPPTPHLPLEGYDILPSDCVFGTRQTADMRRGTEMEPAIAAEYSRLMNVNYSPCGLVIHPIAPWLAASPDGVVFDPNEYPQFGLVEFKCPNRTT
ncbi:hypothetical protein ACER0C_001626 [Sarotherodon galilaeus]